MTYCPCFIRYLVGGGYGSLANSPVAMGLCVCPPDSLGPVWVAYAVWSGQVSPLPLADGFNAVLGQLARWFYPFGSGAHCNNYYYYYLVGGDGLRHIAVYKHSGLSTQAGNGARAVGRVLQGWVAPR
jgi:hypothetical protein